MKIVVVDHVFLTDKHVQKLRTFGELQIFSDPPKTDQEVKLRIHDAEIVIVGWSNITRDIIESAPDLRMISIWATTCHYVDLEAAKERGIIVTHVPGYATEAVAEHAFSLLLASVRRLLLADKHVREGEFDWRPFRGTELAGKTLGLVGTGVIGCRIGEIAMAFKMRILGYDIAPNLKKAQEIGISYVDLQTLLRESDVVSLNVTLTPGSERLIGKMEIEMMRKGAVLVNTSQGKVIDEEALIQALRSQRLSYAGLDVFEQEPLAKDNALLGLDNTVLSPHVGFHTVEALERCTEISIENVAKYIEGHPENICI